MQQEWKDDKKENESEEYIRHKHDRAELSQRFECMVKLRNNKCIVHHKKGTKLKSIQRKRTICSITENSTKEIKESWEIEYDVESGNMVAEGIWSKGKLIEEIRCFNGSVMTELKRNGSDSLDPTKRIPIYVGGFRYDEEYT